MTEERQQLAQEEEMQEDELRPSREEPGTDMGQREASSREGGRAGLQAEGGGEMVDRGDERAPLLETGDAENLRQRWEQLQAGFVDEPRQMVEQADELVGELMQQLSTGFADKRSELEAHWEKGEDVSTEDLRVALTRYRSFFNRLLSA
jgi:hypothetical protein